MLHLLLEDIISAFLSVLSSLACINSRRNQFSHENALRSTLDLFTTLIHRFCAAFHWVNTMWRLMSRPSCTRSHTSNTCKWNKSFCHWLKPNETHCLYWSVFYDSILCCLPGQQLSLFEIKHCSGTIKHKKQMKACAFLSLSCTHTHSFTPTLFQKIRPDLTHHQKEAFQANSSVHRDSVKMCSNTSNTLYWKNKAQDDAEKDKLTCGLQTNSDRNAFVSYVHI